MKANIHHFNYKINQDNDGFFDDEGDPMSGYYFEILASNGRPLHRPMGPYNSFEEAATACQHAWDHKSYA